MPDFTDQAMRLQDQILDGVVTDVDHPAGLDRLKLALRHELPLCFQGHDLAEDLQAFQEFKQDCQGIIQQLMNVSVTKSGMNIFPTNIIMMGSSVQGYSLNPKKNMRTWQPVVPPQAKEVVTYRSDWKQAIIEAAGRLGKPSEDMEIVWWDCRGHRIRDKSGQLCDSNSHEIMLPEERFPLHLHLRPKASDVDITLCCEGWSRSQLQISTGIARMPIYEARHRTLDFLTIDMLDRKMKQPIEEVMDKWTARLRTQVAIKVSASPGAPMQLLGERSVLLATTGAPCGNPRTTSVPDVLAAHYKQYGSPWPWKTTSED